jgi:hypothetical protein
VVLIKGKERNRGRWRIGVVEELYEGRDGVVRGVQLRTSKRRIERAVQFLYPLELSCEEDRQVQRRNLNPQAEVFRPRRRAAQAARDNIAEIYRYEEEIVRS